MVYSVHQKLTTATVMQYHKYAVLHAVFHLTHTESATANTLVTLCCIHYAVYTMLFTIVLHAVLHLTHTESAAANTLLTLCSIHYALYTMRCTLCFVHYAVYTMLYTL
jgi:hypothetical protein